jgi:hypothetical protein
MRSRKSAVEREVERALSKAVTHVFFDRAVPPAELVDCSGHLNESQHARDMLVLVLSSQQQAGLQTPSGWLLFCADAAADVARPGEEAGHCGFQQPRRSGGRALPPPRLRQARD